MSKIQKTKLGYNTENYQHKGTSALSETETSQARKPKKEVYVCVNKSTERAADVHDDGGIEPGRSRGWNEQFQTGKVKSHPRRRQY